MDSAIPSLSFVKSIFRRLEVSTLPTDIGNENFKPLRFDIIRFFPSILASKELNY